MENKTLEEKKGLILKLASRFHIPIEEERLEDYQITNFDEQTPSIEIIDRKTNTHITGKYTGRVELLNIYSRSKKYIDVVSEKEGQKIETVYHIGDETPIITRITTTKDDYELIIEKESSISMETSNMGNSIVVRLAKKVPYNGKKYSQPLLTKRYEYIPGVEEYEEMYTYAIIGKEFISHNDRMYEYTHNINGNITYGLDNIAVPGVCLNLSGICIENKQNTITPNSAFVIISAKCPELSDTSNKAVLIFDGMKEGEDHILKVLKKDNTTTIQYQKTTLPRRKKPPKNSILEEKEIELNNIVEGAITSEELQRIIDWINIELPQDDIVSLMQEGIENFQQKIETKENALDEDLSPRDLVGRTTEEISSAILENKDQYLTTLQKQFAIISNNQIEQSPEKVKK